MYLLFKSKRTTKRYTFQDDSRFKIRICFLQIFACKNMKKVFKNKTKDKTLNTQKVAYIPQVAPPSK